MSEQLVLLGTALAALSGVPGLFFPRRARSGQLLATLLATAAAAALGLSGAGVFWAGGDHRPIDVPWPTVPGAAFAVAVDGLSALFLVPIFVISALGSVYGVGYWAQPAHRENGRKLRLFYGLLTAGMALVVVARNGVLFLAGWEVMALSAFFLVTTEDGERPAREAGWVYLVAAHTAALALFAVFALLRAASGSFALAPLKEGAATPLLSAAIFALALLGFGLKAGIMPLHVWLPSAHAIAPSHVSALMSGVIIKMGVYGLFRVTSLLPSPPVEWGGIVLALGAVSGVLGVVFAVAQHDLKRLLAYHSIENIGIIVMGLGLALIGRSLGRADLVVLGAAGGLLHVWNHALFKSLLFLGAGSVIHATHTRHIDHLGGLSRRMPYTALGFLVGAVAICGLPPLNGFVSEFLIYLGLFDSLSAGRGPSYPAAALAAPALALIGALALACFVKVYGAVFLGTARSAHADKAHESGASMTGPMAVLAGCCFLIGLAPFWFAPLLGRGVTAWDPNVRDAAADLAARAPLDWLSEMGLTLLAALVAGGLLLRLLVVRAGSVEGATWGCGYLAPTPRIQYTSSSFAQMLVALFARVLCPDVRPAAVRGLFPRSTAFHSDVPDTVLDRAILPVFRAVAWLFSWFRVLQQGSIQTYLLYIFLALIALLLWS
jgi:hydrogenase-4 component B